MAEDAQAGGERYYEETGEHGRAGYYVKTVGNAPVVAPTALTADEAAAMAAAPKPRGSGSAWCASCLSVRLGRSVDARLSTLCRVPHRNSAGTWENKDMSKWAKVPPYILVLISGAQYNRQAHSLLCGFADHSPAADRRTQRGRDHRFFNQRHW